MRAASSSLAASASAAWSAAGAGAPGVRTRRSARDRAAEQLERGLLGQQPVVRGVGDVAREADGEQIRAGADGAAGGVRAQLLRATSSHSDRSPRGSRRPRR